MIVISTPTVGILSYANSIAADQLARDIEILSEFFTVHHITPDSPICDILFLYATITSDGRLAGSVRGLREIIRDSGAKVVVVACDNSGKAYVKAGARRPYGQANLVMTIERRGALFWEFFRKIFRQMLLGVSMPEAWAALSPQVQHPQSSEVPLLIFACELGPLTFK